MHKAGVGRARTFSHTGIFHVERVNGEDVAMLTVSLRGSAAVIAVVAKVVSGTVGSRQDLPSSDGAHICANPDREPVPEAATGWGVRVEARYGKGLGAFWCSRPGKLRALVGAGIDVLVWHPLTLREILRGDGETWNRGNQVIGVGCNGSVREIHDLVCIAVLSSARVNTYSHLARGPSAAGVHRMNTRSHNPCYSFIQLVFGGDGDLGNITFAMNLDRHLSAVHSFDG